MHDPATRGVQEGFVALADRYGQQIRSVLRESDNPEQRALAAQVLGYATDKGSLVADLSAAMRDADAGVRNNALRALWLIGVFAQKAPDRKIHVAADPFVDLLDSLTWTDRNKSSLALMSLTESRDAALLSTLRQKAVPALAEMARWKSRGHALAPVMILGRMAGIPEQELAAAAASGSHATIVDAALKRLTGRPKEQAASSDRTPVRAPSSNRESRQVAIIARASIGDTRQAFRAAVTVIRNV